MFNYFLVLKALLRLANFIEATEKTTFNKITNKVFKKNKAWKRQKPKSCSIAYLLLICHI